MGDPIPTPLSQLANPYCKDCWELFRIKVQMYQSINGYTCAICGKTIKSTKGDQVG